jgi:putative lipoic acid-binding regulatory protein
MSDSSLLEFPCDFPLKVMGARHDDFVRTIVEVVQRHALEFDGDSIVTRVSSKGGYLSLTCTIHATSREQLDALYRELSGHPMVKVVL